MTGIRQRSLGKPSASTLLCLSKCEDRYAISIRHIVGGTELGFLVPTFADKAPNAPRPGSGPLIVPEMQSLQDQAVVRSLARGADSFALCGSRGSRL